MKTTEIKLDYDNITVKDVQLIFHHRAWLLKSLECVGLECHETTNGYHVKAILLGEYDPKEVMLIQMLMGSDINREIYNFLRYRNGDLLEHFNRLYTKKYMILSTEAREVGSETPCPVLHERLIHELSEAKDWSDMI